MRCHDCSSTGAGAADGDWLAGVWPTTVPPRDGSEESCWMYRAVNWFADPPAWPISVTPAFGWSALRMSVDTRAASTVRTRPSSALTVTVLPLTDCTCPWMRCQSSAALAPVMPTASTKVRARSDRRTFIVTPPPCLYFSNGGATDSETERADLLAETAHVRELDVFVAANDVGQARELHGAGVRGRVEADQRF